MRLAVLLALALTSIAQEIKLRVTDSFTHLPVEGAEVFLARAAGEKAFQKVGETSSRFFTLQLSDGAATYQFEIRRDGYDSFRSARFSAKDASAFYDVALARLLDFQGVIVAPTGQLAADAQYFLCTDLTQVTLRPDRTFFTRSRAPDMTGPSGKFRLSPESTGHGILVAHDLGYAYAPLAGWTNGSQIRLKPWTQMTGRMLVDGAPAKSQEIRLTPIENAIGRTRLAFLNFETRTDTNGFFTFTNVPPIQVVLERGTPPQNSRLIDASLNTAAPLQIDFRGREIYSIPELPAR